MTGVVVAMLAGLHPIGVIAASIFVAGMLVGADSMSRAAGVPSTLADVVVATSLLCMLVAVMLSRYRVVRG
jgi:simple sugar transport system permease protein